MIYLDNAATTKVHPQVVDAMIPYYTDHFGNPSSIHAMGRKSRSAIEKARKSIAGHLNASTAEIFFTSGGTESNNMVLKNSIRDLGVNRIISSKIEHHCVLHTCDYLQESGIPVDYVKVDELGYFNLEHLESLLKQNVDDTILISLIHANNEIGTINDWIAIGELAKKYNAYFHADTVQTVAHYPINLQDIPVDFISASAHKFHGPKGVGFVYINGDTALQPLFHGGSQERNMRAGTENLAAIVGMGKALDLAYDSMEENASHIRSLKNYFIKQVEQNFPTARFNGDISENSLYTVINVALPATIQSDMLMFNLDIQGICCSAGSACSSGASNNSHVIETISPGSEEASIRFSFAKENNKEEIDQVIAILKDVIQS